MTDLVTTYGKTWHTWQIDRDHDLLLGIPQVMMGFTRDDQINSLFLDDRDRRFGLSTQSERKHRADILTPDVIVGTNSWQSGTAMRLQLDISWKENGSAACLLDPVSGSLGIFVFSIISDCNISAFAGKSNRDRPAYSGISTYYQSSFSGKSF